MSKEYDNHGGRRINKSEKVGVKLSPEEISRKEAVDRIRPILEKDPEWEWASGQKDWNNSVEWRCQKRAVVRLTKKAVHLLFPEYKVSVHRDRGAHNWVDVNFVIPGIERPARGEIIGKTQRLLRSVGIQYASYFPDSGPGDNWRPCLSVSVNHIS